MVLQKLHCVRCKKFCIFVENDFCVTPFFVICKECYKRPTGLTQEEEKKQEQHQQIPIMIIPMSIDPSLYGPQTEVSYKEE